MRPSASSRCITSYGTVWYNVQPSAITITISWLFIHSFDIYLLHPIIKNINYRENLHTHLISSHLRKRYITYHYFFMQSPTIMYNIPSERSSQQQDSMIPNKHNKCRLILLRYYIILYSKTKATKKNSSMKQKYPWEPKLLRWTFSTFKHWQNN